MTDILLGRGALRRLAGVAVAFFLAGAVGAADYGLKSGVTDWTDANSYTNAFGASPAQVPGGDDAVYLPDETFAVDASSPSFGVLSAFKRIVPSVGSRLEITVSEGEATLGCAFNRGGESGQGAHIGELVKKGAGLLKFGESGRIRNSATQYAFDYCTTTVLAEGSLRTTTDAEAVARSNFGVIVSSNDTALLVTADPNRTSSAWAEFETFDFGGLVTNETPGKTTVLYASGAKTAESSKVRGPIGGTIRFWMNGSIDFLSTNSTFTGGVTVQGWNGSAVFGPVGNVGVMKFGMREDAASSLGSAVSHMAHYDGVFRYLGTEPEVTDLSILCYGTLGLDGGAYGALTYNGLISNARDDLANSGQHRLLFSGANEQPCVFGGTLTSNLGSDSASVNPQYSFYVTKRGVGTWTFVGPKNGGSQGWNGGLAVEEGTLQFDSLLEAGRDCALGTALALTDGVRGLWSDEHWVDYAIVLGSVAPASAAVLEYVGSGPAACSTRPIALAGAGGTLKADDGRLTFSGVSARDADSSPTLTLDGTSERNVVKDVSDGAAGAKVNVVKDGAGTWTLGGDLTFSGALTVKNGTLKVKVPDNSPFVPTYKDYKWFKLSIAELTDATGTGASGGSSLAVRQISLLDKNGVRQNFGLTVPDSAHDGDTVRLAALKPGEACFGDNMVGGAVPDLVKNLTICFDGTYSSNDKPPSNPTGSAASIAYRPNPKYTTAAVPTWNDPATWIVIMMRLPDSATPVTHFDIQAFNNSYKQVPRRFQLEASVDGKEWATVWTNVDAEKYEAFEPKNGGYNQWISDGMAGTASNRPAGKGFSLSQSGEEYVQKRYFDWFRISFAKIEGAGNTLYMRQIGLYDKNGVRQNPGLQLAEDVTPAMGVKRMIKSAEIGPGECGYDSSVAGYWMTPGGMSGQQTVDLEAAFNGSESGTEGRYALSWLDTSGANLIPTSTDSKTWIPIVMHLQNGFSPVTQFDVQAFYYEGASRQYPVRMKLEGSIDGERWTEVWSNLDEAEDLSPTLTGYNQWIARTGLASASRADVGEKGFQLTNTYWTVLDEDHDQLQRVSGIQVLPGARLEASSPLEVNALRMSAVGAGTYANLKFAASGTLDVLTDKPLRNVLLSATYENCTGLENVADWSVSVNGVAKPGYTLSVTDDGKIGVTAPGILLIVK